MAKYYADSAKRRAEVIGKPAADWELKGLDGKTHSLADYRGKVVVLDFWYRGCGWCIKAMPQLNALAEQFQGRPVAVLGMNTDRKEADAKFVVDAMGLKYETLRAEGIPEKYGVQGFPTLILIDPEGKVRDVHVGYSPTLRADVAKVDRRAAAVQSDGVPRDATRHFSRPQYVASAEARDRAGHRSSCLGLATTPRPS